MKMRFTTRCARCRKPLHQGTSGVRVYGGLWHPRCAIQYKADREALRVGKR